MSDLDRIQTGLKDILGRLNSMCIENNVKYSLFGGSMIGAIREKGFIPWDDDADIMMERAEYDKFCNIIQDEFDIINVLWVPRLVFKGAVEQKGGEYLDIFVFDNAPNSIFRHKLKVFGLKILQGTLKEKFMWRQYGLAEKVLVALTYLIGMPFSKKSKLIAYEWIARIDNSRDTRYLCSYKDQYRYIHIRYNKSIFSEYITLPFEDLSLMVMKGYHEYLTTVFGNYMVRPPKEERVPQHGHLNK